MNTQLKLASIFLVLALMLSFMPTGVTVGYAADGPLGPDDYDFVAHAAEAAWSSGAGALTFPGAEDDAKGFATTGLHWIFEDELSSPESAILVGPQNVPNGFIQGVFPPFTVKTGDVFKAQIGCKYVATNCYVAFRLRYRIVDSKGVIIEEKTLWKEPPFREKYEGRTYFINQSLNSLAGKTVQFILSVSDYDGKAAGDRALWGNPRIVRSGEPPQPSCTDIGMFISDLDVKDGTSVAPSKAFTKKWRIKNIGTCTWTASYELVFDKGDKMGGPDTVPFDKATTLNPFAPVAPGQTVDVFVDLTAPGTAGNYTGRWKFKNDKGVNFALAPWGNRYLGNQLSFWVKIHVP